MGFSAAATARRLVEPVLTVVFPSACAACGRLLAQPTRGPLCGPCWGTLPRHRTPSCGCGLPLAPGRPACARCRRNRQPFAAGASLGPYEGSLRVVIHELKYRGRRRVAGRLAQVLLEDDRVRALVAGSHVLVPVPLHPRRLHERGFNQASLIAHEVGRRMGRPCDDRALVRRTRHRSAGRAVGGRTPAERGRGLRRAATGSRDRPGGDPRRRRAHDGRHRPRLCPGAADGRRTRGPLALGGPGRVEVGGEEGS